MSADRDRDDTDAPLERALQRVPAPVARAEFRSALRDRFVRASAVASDAPAAAAGASSISDGGRASQDRSTAPSLGANAPARGASETSSAAKVSTLERGGDPRRELPSSQAPDRRFRPQIWIGLLAAAALLVTFGLLWKHRAVEWHVLEAGGAELVRADDTRRPLAERRDLRELHADGGAIESGAYETVLRIADACVLSLAPASLVRFAKPRAGGPLELSVEKGSLRVITGPAIADGGLRVATAAFDVAITGTAFAVDLCPEGTCVCCTRGAVHVTAAGGHDEIVDAGDMCLAKKDGGWQDGGVHADHVRPLDILDAHARALWR